MTHFHIYIEYDYIFQGEYRAILSHNDLIAMCCKISVCIVLNYLHF